MRICSPAQKSMPFPFNSHPQITGPELSDIPEHPQLNRYKRNCSESHLLKYQINLKNIFLISDIMEQCTTNWLL